MSNNSKADIDLSDLDCSWAGFSAVTGMSTQNHDIRTWMLTGASSSVLLGDINQDGNLNVNDVVLAVNIVLGGAFSDYTIFLADINQDDIVNVLDIIALVNIILSN